MFKPWNEKKPDEVVRIEVKKSGDTYYVVGYRNDRVVGKTECNSLATALEAAVVLLKAASFD